MSYNELQETINIIYHLLKTFEKSEYDNFKKYLAYVIQYLDGIEVQTEETTKVIRRLKGLYKWEECDVTHEIIKDCVLDSCNNLDREYNREV